MEKSAKIFVAGYRGLVGSAIVRALQAQGYPYLLVQPHSKLDLTNQAAVREFFALEKPDYVFLAAAKVGGILANNTYKADFIYQNIMIAANVIHAAYKSGVKKLLNLGSSCIYPKFSPQPMKEEHLLTGTLEPTNAPYAIAKISAIKLCRYYNEQYGTNFISVMPTNLYGPNDNYDLETSHVLPALVRKVHLGKCLQVNDFKAIRMDLKKYPLRERCVADLKDDDFIELLSKYGIKNDAVEVWGSGAPFREFLHVDDLADACLYLMSRFDYNDVGELINIGTGVELSIKELAETVKTVVGFGGEIVFDASKPDGTPRKLLDVSRLEHMGWRAKIPLKGGLCKTYEDYKQ